MQRIDEARMAEGNGRTGRLWHTRFEIARRSIDDGMKNGVADVKSAPVLFRFVASGVLLKGFSIGLRTPGRKLGGRETFVLSRWRTRISCHP